MMHFDAGTEIAFHYDAKRSGISRDRRVIVEEMRVTGKGVRVIATPLDSESGRDGVRTFDPMCMTDVRVIGTGRPTTL